MKVRVPQGAGLTRFVLGPVGRYLVIGFALFIILGMGTFTYFYAKYSRLIDEKLRAGPFANTAKIFAAPASVAVGATSPPPSTPTRAPNSSPCRPSSLRVPVSSRHASPFASSRWFR